MSSRHPLGAQLRSSGPAAGPIRPCERADHGKRKLLEISVVHPDRIGVSTCVEYHFRFANQGSIHEDSLEIQTAKWRHRTWLAVGIQPSEFNFPRQANDAPICQHAQLLQVDAQV